MADNISSLKIAVDSSEVKNATNNLNNLTNVSGNTEKSTTSLIGGFTKLKAGALAAAAAVGALAKAGVEYNAQIEKLTNGLTTLNVLTSKNIDSNGKAITLEQKYNLARRESIETMQKLNAINLETPHTLDQTVQIYKAMYTSMKSVGVSSEQMIDLTKKLSIAAGSSGIEFQQLLSGIDGLATGTVEVSSELGRFLKSIGLTNEELKKSSNIYETINNKVKDVKGIIGYEEAVSNLANSFDQLTGELVEPFFDDVKDGITGLAGMFNDLTKSVTLFYDKIKSISELSTKDQLNRRAVEVSERIKTIQEDLKDPSFFQSSGKLSAELRAANLELLAINHQFEMINKQNETGLVSLGKERNEAEIIKMTGTELAKFNLVLDENVEKLKKAGATEEEINIFRKKSIEDFNKSQDKATKESISLNNDLNNALKEMSQVGMNDYQIAIESIKDKTAEWIVAGANYNEVIAKQKQLMEELNLQNSLSIASEQLSFLEKKAQLMTDEYEKAKLLLELKYAQNLLDIEGRNIPIDDKQRLIEQETELYNLTLQRIELDRNTEFNDTLKNFQDDALERQIALNESMYEFGDSFDGIAKQVSTASKAIINMNTISIKAKKEESKLNDKYSKEFLKYANDEVKTKELITQYDKDSGQLKQQNLEAEMAGYANLAGAMAGAFEQGSAGAIAFTTLQATLGIASSWTAIATAWALPFPSNIPAVAMVASAVMPIIGQLTSMGGSGGSGGGGGSSSKSYSQTEIDKFNIEAEYTPMIGRLDRQIELLEKIERNGSAGAIKVDLAGITFEKDYKLLANEFLTNVHNKLKSNWGLGSGARASNEKQFENMLGFNLGDMVGGDFQIDKNSLKQGLNLMKLVETINANWDYFHNSGFGVLLDKDWKQAGDPMSMTIARIGQITNDTQELLHEYTMSLLDSMQDLKDAKEEYISIYEELTDSRVFTDKKLVDAFKSFDSLLATGESYADYIYKEINNLQNLEKFLTSDKIEILLSQDPTKLKAQLDLLDELKRETGLTFQNGAKDAVDFLESIKLVSEALVTSRNNINSFVESFMSDYDLLEMQSQKMGTGIAKSFDELFLQFQTMASDVVGLTDEELSYLEATKSYLEKQNDKEIEAIEEQIDLQEKLLDTIKNNIRTIEGIMNSLKSTIDKLRDSADTTNTYTLNQFYESMSTTQELLKNKDYEAISKSVQKTISYSSALSDAKNFTLTRDMQFAQLAAARQFEEMDITLQGEVDYLRKIEINTRDTVSRLEDMIKALGATITNAFDKNSQAIKNLIAELEKGKGKDVSAVAKLVDEIYTKYDLHKYQKDNSGYDYWQNQVMTGALSVAQLETAIKNSAQGILSGSSGGGSSSSSGGGSTSTPSTSDLISNIYDKYGLHQYQKDNSGYDYWQNQVSSGAIAAADLERAIKAAAAGILGTNSFAVGTPYVERDMFAKIHQGEIITPKNFSDGLRNGDLVMGQTANMVNAINNMGALLSQNVANLENKLNAIISITGTQVNKLDDIYDVSNGSLVSLQNIEGII